ncbi:hypothetical protein GCM10023225_29550 [Kineococcus glutinatus]|uniref:Uncharacterized protein n=1 Tax=Kineococcus glutinatus TaxID=1070872 RepID=A0ABP9I8J0_9ACTN
MRAAREPCPGRVHPVEPRAGDGPVGGRPMFTLIACVALVVAGIVGAMHMETRLGAPTEAEPPRER